MTVHDQHIPGEELVAYLLGECPDVRTAEIDAHVDACAACRKDFAGFVETLGALAVHAPVASPPEGLREVIRIAVVEPPKQDEVVAHARRTRRFAVRWPEWGVGFALATAIGAAALLVFLVPGGPSGGVTVPLSGVGGSLQVTGQRAVLDATRFPLLAKGQTYEMWIIRGGVIRPAGLFGPGARLVPVTGSVAAGDVVAVTEEPAGGTSTPTSAPVAEGRVD